VDRRKELQAEWKEKKTVAGVFQIKNIKNQKVFVDSTRNMSTLNGQKFMLEHRSHINKTLQTEWNEFGAEAFTFEVLETLEKDPDEYYDLRDTLKKLKRKWISRVQPFGDKGYNPVKDM
jgi:hemerythrin-like domain-containing protein